MAAWNNMGRLGSLFSVAGGVMGWGVKKALWGLGIGTAVVVADDAANLGIGAYVKDKSTEIGQGSMEVKELTEARAGQLDSEFKGRNTMMYFAGLASSFLQMLGFTELAKTLSNFIKGQENYLDSKTNNLTPGRTDEQKQNLNNLGNTVVNGVDQTVDATANVVSENKEVLGFTAVAATTVAGLVVANKFKGKNTVNPVDPTATPDKTIKTADTTRSFTADELKKVESGLDDVKKSPSILASSVDDVAKTSWLKGTLMSGFKRNAIGALVIGTGLYVGSKTLGATEAQAQDLATEVIPLKHAYLKAAEGDYENAAQSAVVDVAGYAGFAAGATVGATLGATAGSIVPVVGTVVGGAVGGLVGGVVASGVVSTAADYAWEGGEYVFSKGVDAVNYFWGEDEEPEISSEFNAANNDNTTPKYVADNANIPAAKFRGMDLVAS